MEKPYRPCVRILIVKGDKILLGDKIIDGKFVGYEFPGGGVEKDDDHEETVKKECLEEVGIEVDHVRPIGLVFAFGPNFLNKERQKIFKGGIDTWYMCEYVRKDHELLNIEGDKLPYQWVYPEEAIKMINKTPKSDYNPARLTVLSMVKNDLRAHDKRGYRACARVIIRNKNDQILICSKTRDVGVSYSFPGGGIEHQDSPEDTVYKESLEEVGVKIKNIKNLEMYYRHDVEFMKPERAKKFRGGVDTWCTAEFDSVDTSLLGSDGPPMSYQWVTLEEAVRLIKNGGGGMFALSNLEALQAVGKLNGKDLSIEQRSGQVFEPTVSRKLNRIAHW